MSTPSGPWHPGQPHPEHVEAWRQDIARRGGMPTLPRVGDGLHTSLNFLDAYASLAAVAMARAEFYGQLLQAQMDADADAAGSTLGGPPIAAGLVGFTYATNVTGPARDQTVEVTATGEAARALVELERWERKEAARLIERAVAMNVQLHQTEVIRSYASTISTALQALVIELGLSMDDEPTLRAAQRAALSARRMMGFDDGDPDVHIGPRMTAHERAHVLRAALADAERDAGIIDGNPEVLADLAGGTAP